MFADFKYYRRIKAFVVKPNASAAAVRLTPEAIQSELKNANTATTRLAIPVKITAIIEKPMRDENLLSMGYLLFNLQRDLEVFLLDLIHTIG
jgi:hypothetical protein